jgi:hypothetical protein
MRKTQEEERAMRVDKCQGPNKGLAPWVILCVLSLFTAVILVLPSVVFAQTYELSQDCATALVNESHTITVTVTGDSGPFGFWFYGGPNGGTIVPATFTPDENGMFEYTYTSAATGTDVIGLIDMIYLNKGTIETTWTENEADLCSSSQSVQVGGRTILNVKKKGALRIAVCATDGVEVDNVDLETVQLAGVAPWHSKRKDSRLCPGGKDGVGDLVLKFKNREIVKALEMSLGALEDGKEVGLALTGSLNDGTALEGEWLAVIKNKGKRHWNKKHKKKTEKKCKEKKDRKK